jgi:hypothetical protein
MSATVQDQHLDDITPLDAALVTVHIEPYGPEHRDWCDQRPYGYPKGAYVVVTRRHDQSLKYVFITTSADTVDELRDPASVLAYLQDATVVPPGPNPAPEHLDKLADIAFDAARDAHEEANRS